MGLDYVNFRNHFFKNLILPKCLVVNILFYWKKNKIHNK